MPLFKSKEKAALKPRIYAVFSPDTSPKHDIPPLGFVFMTALHTHIYSGEIICRRDSINIFREFVIYFTHCILYNNSIPA
ncbi:hypothetical protein HMPREF0080_00966 [Anaeroglobus geminatus F0357]|uniref:Uncharacterized protein n=1 Tax=Anaeroglobus geminatus F0357 TaxID=861450 RepID=G9YH41_9FIRM|nr:hypothetical protein HMPREF0080_00966 [Anaeroglobus geminatus F0357]